MTVKTATGWLIRGHLREGERGLSQCRREVPCLLAGQAVMVNNQKVIKNMAYKIRWDFCLRLSTLQHTIHVNKIEPENV